VSQFITKGSSWGGKILLNFKINKKNRRNRKRGNILLSVEDFYGQSNCTYFPKSTLAAYFSTIESLSCIPRRKNMVRILFKLDQVRSNNLFNFKYKK